MADTTDTDVTAAVNACALATAKVQTALDTIVTNGHRQRDYRARLQNAALAVTRKSERGQGVVSED